MDSLQWARSLEWAGSRIEWGSAVGVHDLQPQQFVPPTADPPSSSGGMHDAHDNDRSDLMLDSMLLGSRFSMISIAAEHYVCIKSGLCDSGIDRYIGRGQYPRFETKPLVCRSVEASRFSCEHCDYWAIISNLLTRLARCLVTSTHTVGFLQQLSYMICGKASKFETHWKGDLSDADRFNDWGDFFLDPASFHPQRLSLLSDSAQCQRRHFCSRRAIGLRKGFKEWLLGSLSGGAAAAHAFTKGSGFLRVPMTADGGGGLVSEPSAVMRAKALKWSGFWSRPVFPGRLYGVIGSAREVYLAGESKPEPIDPVVFKATARA